MEEFGRETQDQVTARNAEALVLAQERNWHALKTALIALDEADIAEVLDRLEAEPAIMVFRLLPPSRASEVFSHLSQENREILLNLMKESRIRDILAGLDPDDRTELFEDLPSNVARELLRLLSPEDRKETLTLLGYPEESCGRLMDPRYVAVSRNLSARECLDRYRSCVVGMDPPNVLYVTEDDWRLVDELPLATLAAADPETPIDQLLDGRVVSIRDSDDQEDAVRIMRKYDLLALPVVNRNGRLLGTLTVDDVMDIQAEETTEDVDKGAAVVPLGESYTAAKPLALWLKRLPWLALLAVTGFASGSVIHAFEEVLAGALALAAFIPMLIDTGGNTGSQSAALVIRALALGELRPGKWFHVIQKELAVGLLLGFSVGTVLFVGAWLWKGSAAVGLTVGFAAFFIALWANMVGGLLPLLIKKLGLDPAVVSSPLITTLIDVTGLLIYFYAAKVILGL